MKKVLLSALLCLCGAGSAIATDYSTGFTALDRTNWTITASSEEETGESSGANGFAKFIIDDSMDTYWHSSYNGTNAWGGSSNPHFFIIDMGSSQSFNTVKFSRRNLGTASQNGCIESYKIYVSDSEFGLTAGNSNTKTDIQNSYSTFAKSNSPVLEETVTFDSSTPTSTFFLPTTQTAQYILFVMNGANGFANCADFKVGTMTDEGKTTLETEDKAALTEYKSAATAKIDAALKLLPTVFRESDCTSAKTTISNVEYTFGKLLDAKIAVDNACYAVFENVAHQVVTITNVRRTGSGDKHYLYANANSKVVNTTTTLTEYGKWELVHVSGTEYFKLHNVGVDAYLSSSNNSYANANADGACQVRFIENTNSEFPGVAMEFTGSTNTLNVDSDTSVLASYWELNDGGSSWVISLASVAASELKASDENSKTYYKIRSNRGLTEYTAQGSLLGIDGGAGSQAINEDYARMATASELGTYWYLTAKDGGGYELHNLISDYTADDATVNYGLTTPESNNSIEKQYAVKYAWMTAEPTTYYILPATSYNDYSGHHTTAVAISKQATAGGQGTCIDLANYTGYDNSLNYRHAVADEWYPTGGDSDNGSTYYFELADNADVEAAKAAYIAGCETVADPFEALSSCPEALLTKDEISESRATVEKYLTSTTTDVASANAKYKAEDYSSLQSEATAAVTAAYDACIAKMDGKEVHISNVHRGDTKYMSVSDDNMYVSSSASLSEIWTLQQVSGMSFKFYNNKTGKYIGSQTSDYTKVPAVDAENACTFELLISSDGEIAFVEDASTSHPGLHLDGNTSETDANGKIVKWTNDEGSASWWQATAVTTTATLDSPKTATISSGRPTSGSSSAIITITYEGATTVALTSGAENFVITVTPKGAESTGDESTVTKAAALRRATAVTTTAGSGNVSVNGNAATFTLENVENGEYEVTVPTGFFTVDDVLSAAIAQSVTIDNTDGIDTVVLDSAAAAAADVIYDLQGRRVSTITRPGIYIVNGHKLRK